MSFFEELRRRNVIRVGIAYAVIAWVLAQIADLALDNFEAPGWVIKTILLILALGFPLALFFAWAFELTPEGIKKEKDVDRSQSITPKTGRKLDFVIIGMLAVALAYFIWESRFAHRPVQPTVSVEAGAGAVDGASTPLVKDRSVAVLPFANRSNLDDDLFFTDGIHDDLLTQLAKINDLKVISRTSVMQYRETDKRIPEIARELGVATILEGGVQRAGKRIRINAQLIDVATDEHLWAETFDREMTIDNLFEIQSEITKQIVSAVKGQLTPEEQNELEAKPTNSLAAWEAYSKARDILQNSSAYTAEMYLAAQPFAEQAVRLDPDFVMAQVILAEIHGQAYWIGYDRTEQRRQAARDVLDKAISLAPNAPEVLLAQGNYLYRFEQDYPAALDLLLRASAAKPGDADIIEQLGNTQRRLGLWDEAVASFLRADQLNPGTQWGISGALATLSMMRDEARTRALIPSALARFPGSREVAIQAMSFSIWADGDVEAARRVSAEVSADASESYFALVELPWFERDLEAVVAGWEHPALLAYLAASTSGETSPLLTAWRTLNLAQAYRQMGKEDQAALHLAEVVKLLTPIDYKGHQQNVARQLFTLAIARALRGENEQAIRLANETIEITRGLKDQIAGPNLQQPAIYALGLAGQRDEALELIEMSLEVPGGFRRWELYLDPRWDFFRDDERFNELIKPLDFEESPHAKTRP